MSFSCAIHQCGGSADYCSMCGPTVKPSAKFFKPEDFVLPCNELGRLSHSLFSMADVANAKLLKESRLVYSENGKTAWYTEGKGCDAKDWKALLINIEEIKPCTHPPDKVTRVSFGPNLGLYTFECECGAKLKITSFEEIK